MSRGTERSLKAMHEFLDSHAAEDMSIDEVNTLLQEHMAEINSSISRPTTEKDAKTAEDFIDLAEQAEKRGDEAEALRLVRKAIKLDPNDLDAELMAIRLGEKDPLNALKRLRLGTEKGRRQLEKKGYFSEEYIGEFWGVLEARPYLRMRNEYTIILKEYGMLRQAACEGEDMIRLNTGDNLGIRFILMHIYAALEDSASAEALLQKYSDHDEGQMLLPLALLYYKLGKTEKAESYLKRIAKNIEGTRRFLRDLMDGNAERKLREIMKRGGYSPFTEEELIMAWHENDDIYESTPTFFLWAANVLKVKR